ncbi:MAG TPA: hypothetical protein VFM45_10665, partial [Anaeromyxobacteraceae bacterium]|nr:hypothetical protein [Anaeromyxobacteraceae bacterium]
GTALRSVALACNACHAFPGSMTHANGAVDMSYGSLASGGGVTPSPATLSGAARTTWEATPTCTNYCHGGKWAADANTRGTLTSPSWTGTSTAAACTACHQAPPNTSIHSGATDCSLCHNGYTCTTANLAACTVNKTVHLNGVVDAAGGSCTGCHASAITSTKFAGVTRRPVTPEFGYAWSHKRSANPSRTVTPGDCGVCHMEGDTSGNMSGTYHGDGYVNLRDPDTGLQIKQVTFGGTGAGGYSSTAVDATFVTWGRNLSSNALEATVQAVMINQCLKCHDSNGATSAAARIGTVAAKPFNTTIGSTANYTGTGITAAGTPGGVTDVNASFATTNSSYHPVRGKQNNSFAAGTRMVAPWNMTKTAGSTTGWGYLMSCWDCHAPQGATGLQTFTVTAHGGTTTLRGTATHATGGTQPAAAGAVTLCNACHRLYNTCGSTTDACATTTSHGAGSAFSSNPGRSTKSAYLRYACNKCHASGYTTAVVRPQRAIDSHGTNVLPSTGTKTSRWSTDPRPFAFIRNTQMFSSHQPKQIGTTTYTPNCVHLNDGDCSSRTETYSAGGTY